MANGLFAGRACLNPGAHAVRAALTTLGSPPNWLAPDQLESGSDFFLRALRQLLQGLEPVRWSGFAGPEVRPFPKRCFLHDRLFAPGDSALLHHGLSTLDIRYASMTPGERFGSDGEFFDLEIGKPFDADRTSVALKK